MLHGSNHTELKSQLQGSAKTPLYPTSFRKSYGSKTEKEKENDGNQMCRIDNTLEYTM